MKKLVAFTIFCLIFNNLKSQEILTISPNSTNLNDKIDLTISGQNAHFSQASNIVWFSQGTSTTVYPNNIIVQNDNEIDANVTFAIYDPTGMYNVNVYNSIDGIISLENGITVYPQIIPELVTVSPEEANKGDIIELTITGENTNFNQSSKTVYFTQGSNTIIYPQNTNVLSNTEMTAKFAFFNSYETGKYSLEVSNDYNGIMYMENCFTLNSNPTPPELISNSPEKSPRNENITLLISGENTNFSQSTNTIWLNQNDRIIYANTSDVISDTRLEANFELSNTDSIGYYNLNVENEFDGDLKLENSFFIDYGTLVSSQDQNKLLIFPNPSNGNFRIESIPNSNCIIKIIALDGTVIKTYNNSTNSFLDISVSGLKGYYFVSIKNKNTLITRKILIQ